MALARFKREYANRGLSCRNKYVYRIIIFHQRVTLEPEGPPGQR